MNYLTNYNFSNEEIDALIKNIPDALLERYYNSYRLVEANLKYLINLEVKNYKDIFVNYYDLFLLDNSNFKNIFEQYDREDLVNKLEQNIELIEFL